MSGDDDLGERPFSIVAFLGTQVLGDFIEYHLQAASVARSVRNARLLVVYRDDRPYKGFATLLNPAVTSTLALPADANSIVPIDWFDGRTDVPGRPFGPEWYANRFHDPDLLLTPSMMGLHLTRRLGPPPGLRIPEAMEASLAAALEGTGVRRDGWFATLHLRESGYEYRKGISDKRSVDPLAYLQMVEAVIERMGGQVVRLGDPSMTPFPDMPGLIDLSRVPDSFPLQAYAVSRSRFYIGTASGPLALACAFKVPTATTNALHVSMWNDGNVVLPQRDISFDGRTIHSGREFIEALDAFPGVPRGMTYRENTPEELCRCAEHMYEATADCATWRPPVADGGEAGEPAADRVTLPFKRRRIVEGGAFTWL